MAFQLDTSGSVGPMPAGPMNERFLHWDDLSPFTQGYIEAMMRDVRDLDRLTDLPPDDRPPRVGPYWVRFSDLAPETLARIIADCEARAARLLSVYRDKRGGHEFWEAHHIGAAPDDFPPLTIHLCDDGKVRFACTSAKSTTPMTNDPTLRHGPVTADLQAIAKDAAERVHKNGGCVPQLAFAPILFALQDALARPAEQPAQQAPSVVSDRRYVGTIEVLTDLLRSGGTTFHTKEQEWALKSAITALSARVDPEPVAWRTNVLNTIVGTDAWRLTDEPYRATTGEKVREVQTLGVIAAPQSGEVGAIPADVTELVLAARSVAFGDGPPDREQIKRLDAASEAFASRVPWDDEPDDAASQPVPEPVAWQKPEIEQDDGEICVRAFSADNTKTISFSIRRDKVVICESSLGTVGSGEVIKHNQFADAASQQEQSGEVGS